MDHRTEKTKQSIYNAFIGLRAKMPLEKLTVKELCETANINKSTFYVYYHDVYDLSDKIENEIISEVIKSLDNTAEILTDPAGFSNLLFFAYNAQRELISVVFSGNRAGMLPKKIEAAIKETIFSLCPQYRDDTEFNIRLTYCIYGGYYAYKEHCKNTDKSVTDVIGSLSEKVMK